MPVRHVSCSELLRPALATRLLWVLYCASTDKPVTLGGSIANAACALQGLLKYAMRDFAWQKADPAMPQQPGCCQVGREGGLQLTQPTRSSNHYASQCQLWYTVHSLAGRSSRHLKLCLNATTAMCEQKTSDGNAWPGSHWAGHWAPLLLPCTSCRSTSTTDLKANLPAKARSQVIGPEPVCSDCRPTNAELPTSVCMGLTSQESPLQHVASA